MHSAAGSGLNPRPEVHPEENKGTLRSCHHPSHSLNQFFILKHRKSSNLGKTAASFKPLNALIYVLEYSIIWALCSVFWKGWRYEASGDGKPVATRSSALYRCTPICLGNQCALCWGYGRRVRHSFVCYCRARSIIRPLNLTSSSQHWSCVLGGALLPDLNGLKRHDLLQEPGGWVWWSEPRIPPLGV